jgi:hypothetical protein
LKSLAFSDPEVRTNTYPVFLREAADAVKERGFSGRRLPNQTCPLWIAAKNRTSLRYAMSGVPNLQKRPAKPAKGRSPAGQSRRALIVMVGESTLAGHRAVGISSPKRARPKAGSRRCQRQCCTPLRNAPQRYEGVIFDA